MPKNKRNTARANAYEARCCSRVSGRIQHVADGRGTDYESKRNVVAGRGSINGYGCEKRVRDEIFTGCEWSKTKGETILYSLMATQA